MVQANGHLEESINTVQPDQQYLQPLQLFWNAGGRKPRHVFDAAAERQYRRPGTRVVRRGLASTVWMVTETWSLVPLGPKSTAPGSWHATIKNSAEHWLRCRVEGPAGNPHAIGTMIKLSAGGRGAT